MATIQSITSQSDGFVVVSLWKPEGQPLAKGDYEYEHQPTLNDALDLYRDYEDGQWSRARAIGVFAAKDGLPIGGRIDPAQLMQLMAETRKAA
jgi:hypothetical protein